MVFGEFYLAPAGAEGPAFIFKHSATCPISAAAHRGVEAWLEETGSSAPVFHRGLVIESRVISDEIASRLGITHGSPQLILVKNGSARWDASHGAITGSAIEKALARAAA